MGPPLLWYVANVPVIFGIDLPSQVFKISPERVFCLVSEPKRLSILRKARHEHLGKATGEYAEFEFVRKEMNYAKELFFSIR